MKFYLPKPIYQAKPFIYAVAGFTAAALPLDNAYKVAGLVIAVVGIGHLLNRMKYPISDKK
jgi:hypothetical protein